MILSFVHAHANFSWSQDDYSYGGKKSEFYRLSSQGNSHYVPMKKFYEVTKNIVNSDQPNGCHCLDKTTNYNTWQH